MVQRNRRIGVKGDVKERGSFLNVPENLAQLTTIGLQVREE